MNDSFSKRSGYTGQAKEITLREGVTDYVRHYAILDAKSEYLSYSTLRDIVCRIVGAAPDLANNWSDGNVRSEIDDLVSSCDWWFVYDIIEKIYAQLEKAFLNSAAADYAKNVNEMFVNQGIGWKLEDGLILTRGSEVFEVTTRAAVVTLDDTKRDTARTNLQEALHALSRRPKPNLTGSVFHAMASLECVARDLTGDPKSTLGGIVKNRSLSLPPPLDEVAAKVWGYASNEARHVAEGKEISFAEAEMVVGLSSVLVTYLIKKHAG